MTKIKIVTDSSITIEPELAKDLDITIVPLTVMIDGVVYSDSNLKEGEFLQLMKSSKNLQILQLVAGWSWADFS